MPNNTKYLPLASGFYPELQRVCALFSSFDLSSVTLEDIDGILASPCLGELDFLKLLSPAAEKRLENMAQRAREETLKHFGKTVQLFTPLYLANFCTNRCVYCGFNTRRDIPRQMLTLEQVENEARTIAASGLRKILALTGDAPAKTGASYLADCVRILAKHFSSVGIEVPSMTVDEYRLVTDAGADGMTMFQETYNEPLYATLHPAGPKRDFAFRLDAPERAILGGMRSVNLGALLGLDDWQRDIFCAGLHAAFLQKRYPEQEVSMSFPRLRPCGKKPSSPEELAFRPHTVEDKHFVQALMAFRIFMPQAGMTLSTREPAWLRDRLIPLGITRISGGVSTAVGGHIAETRGDGHEPQFDISDPRSVDEMAAAIERLGYQPVFADWLLSRDGQANLTGSVASALGNTAQVAALA